MIFNCLFNSVLFGVVYSAEGYSLWKKYRDKVRGDGQDEVMGSITNHLRVRSRQEKLPSRRERGGREGGGREGERGGETDRERDGGGEGEGVKERAETQVPDAFRAQPGLLRNIIIFSNQPVGDFITSFSLSLSLSHTHTQMHKHACAH